MGFGVHADVDGGIALTASNSRTESAALFDLVRNIGSSIGISMVSVVLTRNIQVNHARTCRADDGLLAKR